MFLLANSEDPDQTPRSVASDLGLHCLPMSHPGEVTNQSQERPLHYMALPTPPVRVTYPGLVSF